MTAYTGKTCRSATAGRTPPENSGGNLVIRDDAVSTPGPSGRAGIYRPINLTGPVTVSATFIQQNGWGGLLRHHDADLLFGSDGSLGSGYGWNFYRADQNYADSRVTLKSNGATLATFTSSFQFRSSITVTVALATDGSMAGSVSGSGSIFNFTAPPRPITLLAANVAIDLGFPDSRSEVITNGKLENVSITSACSAKPERENR